MAYTQSRDVRLREVSLAVIDAKLLGAGLLMLSPTNDFQWIPLEAVTIDTEVLNRLREERCSQ